MQILFNNSWLQLATYLTSVSLSQSRSGKSGAGVPMYQFGKLTCHIGMKVEYKMCSVISESDFLECLNA